MANRVACAFKVIQLSLVASRIEHVLSLLTKNLCPEDVPCHLSHRLPATEVPLLEEKESVLS
jgi:hypothetical protein